MTKEKTHILIVDDEPVARAMISYILNKHHYKITEAESGPQALELLQNDPTIELMMLDRMMPEMSGLDVLEKMRALPQLSHIPVIMLTGHAERDHVKTATIYGAFDVIYKPVEEILLIKLIERALRSRR